MKKNVLMLLLPVTMIYGVWAQGIDVALHPDDLLIEDFEDDGFGDWSVEGDAFGDSPVSKERLQDWGDNRFEGHGMATSYVNGDGVRVR